MATEGQIMEALGRAVYAAQNFELNLGSLLLFLTVESGDHGKFTSIDGKRDIQAVEAFLEEVDRLTIGQLKGKLEALKVLDEATIAQISEINAIRKRLVHYFVTDTYDRMNTVGAMDQVLAELIETESNLRAAWMNLQEFLTAKAVHYGYSPSNR